MGLIVSPGRVVGVDSEPHKAIRIRLGLRHHIVGIVVECTTIGGTLTRSEEALDEGWFDPDDLPLLIPSNYERIANTRAGRETVLR